MALMPKRVKHRKLQRGRIRGKATRGNTVAFGDFGLQALEPGWITSRQIEAGRITANQVVRTGGGRLWIRIFPQKSVTSTPLETRMGKGKGDIDFWCAVIKEGTILYEVGGVPLELARRALARTAHKMPLKCRLVTRRQKI